MKMQERQIQNVINTLKMTGSKKWQILLFLGQLLEIEKKIFEKFIKASLQVQPNET